MATGYWGLCIIDNTHLVLTAPYTGAGGSGAVEYTYWPTVTNAGASVFATSSVLSLTSGTAIGDTYIVRGADYGPMTLRATFKVSQRITDEVIRIGFYDSWVSPTTCAAIELSGTNATQMEFVTRSSANIADEKRTLVVGDQGQVSSNYNSIVIEVDNDQCALYYDLGNGEPMILLAIHKEHIAKSYQTMDVYVGISNSATVTNTTLSIDSLTYDNFDFTASKTIAQSTPNKTYILGADKAVSGVLSALNDAVALPLSGFYGAGVQVHAGTLAGTLIAELSYDGINWFPTKMMDPVTDDVQPLLSLVNPNPESSKTLVMAGGAGYARVRVYSYVSGSCTITFRASQVDEPTSPSEGAINSTIQPSVASQIGGYDGTNYRAIKIKDVGGENALVVTSSGITVNQGTSPWIVKTDGSSVDANNSSSVLLGANATFTGTATDVLTYSQILVNIYSNVAGTISFQFSVDGTNWDFTDSYVVSSGVSFIKPMLCMSRWFRIIYTNGATPQSTFRLQTILKPAAQGSYIMGVADHPTHSDLATLTKAIISGETTAGGGGYVDVKVNPSGTLVVDASGSTVPVSGTFWPVTQPISAASLPLPAGAATETTLASLLAKFGVLGQATMAGSAPVVIASNQSAIPVSGTFWQATQPVSGIVTANAGTGTFAISAASLPLPAGAATETTLAKLAIAQGTALGTNTVALMGGSVTTSAPTYTTGQISPLSLDTTGALRITGSITATNPSVGTIGSATPTSGTTIAGTDGTNLRIPAVINNTPVGTEYALVTRLIGGASGGTSSNYAAAFPAAGTAIGVIDSTATNMTFLKANASNALVVDGSGVTQPATGTKTNNNAAPGATNFGTLPAVANAAAPTWTEGNQVALSTDLSGALRIAGSITATNPSVGITGSAIPN